MLVLAAIVFCCSSFYPASYGAENSAPNGGAGQQNQGQNGNQQDLSGTVDYKAAKKEGKEKNFPQQAGANQIKPFDQEN